eukprot:Clim_evm19s199 gene=Clim_evmTU19s199
MADVNESYILAESKGMSDTLSDRFYAAVQAIQDLPQDGPIQPTNADKLNFYSLYKQATVGPCNAPKPNFWDVIAKAKWEAWNGLGDMSKVEAMQQYIETFIAMSRLVPQEHRERLDKVMAKVDPPKAPYHLQKEAAQKKAPSQGKKQTSATTTMVTITLEERFTLAVETVQGLPSNGPVQPSNTDKLNFYSLYKQATNGPCNVPQPGIFNVIARAKWEAWNALGDIPAEEAKLRYVEGFLQMMEKVPEKNKADLLPALERIGKSHLTTASELGRAQSPVNAAEFEEAPEYAEDDVEDVVAYEVTKALTKHDQSVKAMEARIGSLEKKVSELEQQNHRFMIAVFVAPIAAAFAVVLLQKSLRR